MKFAAWAKKSLTKTLVVVLTMQAFLSVGVPEALALTWGEPSANTQASWKSITYGNGILCAVATGGGERSMYSSDGGNTWTYSMDAPDEQWVSVIYAEGLFVAVGTSGSQRVMTSTDCDDWTPRNSASDSQAWRSVTYGEGQFVAVGCGVAASLGACGVSKAAMTSPDGISWTLQTSGVPDTAWTSVAFGGGEFVAVGTLFSGTQRVMRSTDGVTWTGESVTGTGQWESVTYGNGRFVAVASNNSPRIMYSDNGGDTWSTATAPVTGTWSAVKYAVGSFVAVSQSDEAMSSTDGINWSQDSGMPDQRWRDLAWAEGYWVAVACSSSGLSCNNTLANRAIRTGWVPTPTLSGISPNTRTTGSGDFTMTLTGTNFTPITVARVNGSDRVTDTTNWESGSITATILASDISTAGTRNISVRNNAATSGNQTLTINNPAPVLSNISPTSVAAGGGDFTLTVNGSDFISGSQVRVNGSGRTTTFVNSGQLTATVLASDISTPGTKSITVFTATPGGGTSGAQTLTINIESDVIVTHTPASPLTTDSVTIAAETEYVGGIDSMELYLDGDLVHTCNYVGEPTDVDCEFEVGQLDYGTHLTEAIVYSSDSGEFEGEESFHVSDYTTVNSVTLTRLKVSESAAATVRYTLESALTGPAVVTFPAGFVVNGAPTSGSCSGGGSLGNFSYNGPARTITAVKTNCSGIVTISGATIVNPPTPGVYQITWINDDPGGAPVYITDEDQINVTANVDPYVTFRVVASTDACDNGVDGTHDDTTPAGNGGTVAFGTLSPTAVASSDVSGVNHVCTFVSTNAADGYNLSIRSLNGQLLSGSTGAAIPTAAQTGASSSATAAAGTQAYGMCLLSSGGVGMDVSIPVGDLLDATAPFDSTCTAVNTSQSVGRLTTSTNTIGANGGPVQDGWARWLLKASIPATQGAATDYADTLTFVATATY